MTNLNGVRVLKGITWLAFLVFAQAGCTSSNTSIEASADLGEAIFFDLALSADGRTNCATCHNPKLAFSDGQARAIGVLGRQGTRNAPSLLNTPIDAPLFWDGREARLHDAVMQPFFNRMELGLQDPAELISRIGSGPAYPPEFKQLIRSLESADALRVVSQSLAEYISSLASSHESAISSDTAQREEARRGQALFEGSAGCSECHVSHGGEGPFTDYAYHNTGLGNGVLLGNLRALLEKTSSLGSDKDQLSESVLSTAEVAELGRFIVSADPSDIAAFRTPSLHHVGKTAPYMHDGSIRTLEEVVEHELYYRGLARGRPIELTVSERRQLLAYLNTLGATKL